MQSILPVAFVVVYGVLLFGSAGVWLVITRRLERRQPVIAHEPHAVVPWTGWDVIFLACVALALESAALRGSLRDGELPLELTATDVVVQSAAHLVWLAFGIAFLWAKVGAKPDDVGFDVTKLRGDLRLGGRVFLSVLLPVYGIQLLLTQLMPSEHPLARLAKQQPDFGTLALATFSAVAVAPFFEEFIFRIVLQGWFEKWEALWRERTQTNGPLPAGLLANVIVATIFGAMHWGHGPDPAALFVLSLILGYSYQQTHRIVVPLVVHVCFNALAVLELWVTVM
ncbi:MAG TPA: JDVT-CTERM system glutamic-type intramembrane protease [Pirellulales bacterium]|nr:JDVT-CTERM system glutamic-type intramembrane protease [Pirellulales bacterium]